eukprot:m.249289 g.249289  ORF g.249289 m.249289 type:complete len:1118 (+) comp33871_c6_seq1:122-3475(+)
MKTSSVVVLVAVCALATAEQSCFTVDSDEQSCKAIAGCIWKEDSYSQCGAKTFDCDSITTDETDCTSAFALCAWEAGGDPAYCYLDDTCYVADSEATCTIDGCEWTTTTSNYCAEDIVDCFGFEDKASCEAELTSDDKQACTFAETSSSYCSPYDNCARKIETECNGECAWNFGFCEYTEPADSFQDCYGTDTPFTATDCATGPRAGQNRSQSCMWVVETDGECNPYSECGGITDQTECTDKDVCMWNALDNRCSELQTTPIPVVSCFESTDETDCSGLKNSQGETACSWLTTSSSSCEPDNPCSDGTETTCDGITECEWTSFGDDDSVQGFCTMIDPETQNPDCYSTEIDQCETTDGCFVQTFDNSNCATYSACYPFSQSDCDGQQGLDNNCAWNTFSLQCQGAQPTPPPTSMAPTPYELECFAGNSQSDCEGRPRDSDDNRTDPRCIWIEEVTTFCENFDACNDLDDETTCGDAYGCSWFLQDGDDIGLPPCTSDGSGTTPEGAAGVECYVFNDETECNGAGKGGDNSKPQICKFSTSLNDYCNDYSHCIGGNKNTEAGCEATDDCWWDSWGEGEYDGSCVEGVRPPTETTQTTSQPITTPPPPPTPCFCGQDQFKCVSTSTEVSCDCITVEWFCDDYNDCADGSDEVDCPTSTSTSSTQTARSCGAYDLTCADRTCVSDIFNEKRCDGKSDCDDGSDETACPTPEPTQPPISSKPTTAPTPRPTASPQPNPTPAPTVTPDCLPICGTLEVLNQAKNRPTIYDNVECRACVENIESVEKLCELYTSPRLQGCVTTPQPPDAPLTVFLVVPAGKAIESVQNALIDTIKKEYGLSSLDLGLITNSQVEGATWSITLTFVSTSDQDKIARDLKNGRLYIPQSSKMESVDFFETAADATNSVATPTSKPTTTVTRKPTQAGETAEPSPAPTVTRGSPTTAPPSPPTQQQGSTSDDGDGNQMMLVIIIIVVFVVISIGVVIFVIVKFRGGSKGSASLNKRTYDNPVYASGTPPWADPNVPFMSREEAEAKIRSDGMQDGSYCVRQSTNTPNGYIVTAVNRGEFTNIQLKYNNGALQYGGVAVGGKLDEAIKTLKTAVMVQPKSGAQYFLGTSNLDFEADA